MILEYRAGLDELCKLRVVGSWYSMTGYAIALPKGLMACRHANDIPFFFQNHPAFFF
jgi:hypothetical protein